MISNVLDELDADLALCVGDREDRNPLYDRARHVWRLSEPDDWGDAYDRTARGRSWRVLLEIGQQLLGGVEDTEHPQVGSGAIILYFRQFLKESLEREGLVDAYDWIVLTRSDFMWPVVHPDVQQLSDRHIYVLDGEQYGGVSDRHFIVPRRYLKRFLRIVDPIFLQPESLKRRIERATVVHGWRVWNPERFLALRLKELGLWRRVRYLPYAPFAVRAPGGSTRWVEGVFDEQRGYYVKYPQELERSQIAQRFISDQESWRRYLSLIRGARMRYQTRRTLRDRGLYERALPPVRRFPTRTYRWIRWTGGRELRKVPALERALDARQKRIQERTRLAAFMSRIKD